MSDSKQSEKTFHFNVPVHYTKATLESFVEALNENCGKYLEEDDPIGFYKAFAKIIRIGFSLSGAKSSQRAKASRNQNACAEKPEEGCIHKFATGVNKGLYCNNPRVRDSEFCQPHYAGHVGALEVDGVQYNTNDNIIRDDGKQEAVTLLIPVNSKNTRVMYMDDNGKPQELLDRHYDLRDKGLLKFKVACHGINATNGKACANTCVSGTLCAIHLKKASK